MCTHLRLSLASLSLSLSLNPSSHVDDQVLERKKKESRLVFIAVSPLQMSDHFTLSRSCLLILCFNALHLFLPIMKLLTHTHTYTHAHCRRYSCAKSSVLCGTPLNNYFYDLLPNDSCWLHNQAKCTAVHIWIYKHIHTNTHNGECDNGSANSHTEMEQVETSSG